MSVFDNKIKFKKQVTLYMPDNPVQFVIKQNCRSRSSIMFPVTGSDRIVYQKKMKVIFLKHFMHQSLTLPGEF